MPYIENKYRALYPNSPTTSFMVKAKRVLRHCLRHETHLDHISLLRHIKKHLNKTYTNPHTRHKYHVIIRKVVRRHRPDLYTHAARIIAFEPREKLLMRRLGEETVEHNNKHVTTFEEDEVRRWASTLHASNRLEDKVIWLMLQSGCRMIEIIKTCSIKPVSGSWVQFRGLCKTRDPHKRITKPLLTTTASIFSAVLAHVRTHTPPLLSKEKTTLKFNAAVNARLRELTGRVSISSHMARKIYAALSYTYFADKQRYSLNAWIKKVLGHKSLLTSLSYCNVHITPSPRPHAKNERNGARIS